MDKKKIIETHLAQFNEPGFNVMKAFVEPKFADPLHICRFLEQGNTLPVITKQVILKLPLMDQLGAVAGIFTAKSKQKFAQLFEEALVELEYLAKISAN